MILLWDCFQVQFSDGWVLERKYGCDSLNYFRLITLIKNKEMILVICVSWKLYYNALSNLQNCTRACQGMLVIC